MRYDDGQEYQDKSMEPIPNRRIDSLRSECIGNSPVKTFFLNWVVLIIHNEPLCLTAKSIYIYMRHLHRIR